MPFGPVAGLTVEPVQVGAAQFNRPSNRQRHRAWQRRSGSWCRRTVCRPAATERGVAVSKTQAIELSKGEAAELWKGEGAEQGPRSSVMVTARRP